MMGEMHWNDRSTVTIPNRYPIHRIRLLHQTGTNSNSQDLFMENLNGYLENISFKLTFNSMINKPQFPTAHASLQLDSYANRSMNRQ